MELPAFSNLESSTQILVAEHARMTQLYLYNAEMGEKRTSLYLSVVSLGGAGLIGLTQIMETSQLFWPTNAFLLGALILGLLTFQRLIERRVRAVENLRALNRIHRYFVDHDPQLLHYFYWPPCDDWPAFRNKGGLFAGLRDVISFINSLFAGFLASEAITPFVPTGQLLPPIGVGLLIFLAAWGLQHLYEGRVLDQADRQAAVKDVRFPMKVLDGKIGAESET